jgi:rhodanese-related sulfurtransferase
MKRDAPAMTLDELLHRSRSRLSRVPVEELETEVEAGAMLVDVRTAEQRERDGDLAGAHVIDYTVLEWRLAPSSKFREIDCPSHQRVILVCSQGYSSSLAAARLQDLGLTNVTDLEGGYEAWRAWKDRVD